MKTLVSNLFTKGFSVKAVLYRTNQYRSRMEINLHSFDCKYPKCWVIGSWGTTVLYNVQKGIVQYLENEKMWGGEREGQ